MKNDNDITDLVKLYEAITHDITPSPEGNNIHRKKIHSDRLKQAMGEEDVIHPFPNSPMTKVYWDKDSQIFYLDRGFSSTTMTLSKEEAILLRNILDIFLQKMK